MKNIPTSLINTWLFLIKSEDPKLTKSKALAAKHIKQNFGNSELAHLYIEQLKDKTIEIILI
ncbi:hypothetical protein [Thalassotalea piscium]|uniref:Uncharacterized protein n=1 Tax=Thalassotalea piscium TaxID=1230533 RepID=A0A7X0NF12_9GAMM|nr:hypothetical protein [Thalassotalea piscium]MBB6542230.1 hypothetical protein [Thalassotalea piscium]